MSSQHFPPYENHSNNIKVQLIKLIMQQKMMLKI